MLTTGTNSAAVESAIQEIVSRLVPQFHPEKLILFGSAARGGFGSDSDLDILVVAPIEGSRRALAAAMEVALFGIPVPIDLVVVTPQELERDRARVGTVVRPALEEGRVIYDRVH